MANILNSTYESDNFKPNSKTYQITITIDTDLTTIDEVNSILANNGSRYKTINGIAYVSTNSTGIVYSPNFMYIYKFIAENGSINSSTGYQEGVWKCLGKKSFVTT